MNRIVKDCESARRLKAVIHYRLHSSELTDVTSSLPRSANVPTYGITTASTYSLAQQFLNDGLSGYLECLNSAVYREMCRRSLMRKGDLRAAVRQGAERDPGPSDATHI
jgi:hypothetical protein